MQWERLGLTTNGGDDDFPLSCSALTGPSLNFKENRQPKNVPASSALLPRDYEPDAPLAVYLSGNYQGMLRLQEIEGSRIERREQVVKHTLKFSLSEIWLLAR